MMTDAGLQEFWPDLAIVVVELRRVNRAVVADLLVDAVSHESSSSEILGRVGVVLRGHRALRSQLGAPAKRAWNSVIADVYRQYPLSRLGDWFAQLIGR